MSGMQCLLGLRTDDFVLLAADRTSIAHGAIVVSQAKDKAFELGDKLVMTCVGEGGDVAQFGDYTAKNLQLYKLRNGYEMSPRSAHHWIRKAIADSLRTRDYYVVDTLIAGFDDHDHKAYLGSVNYLGCSVTDQRFLFQGFSGRFCYSIMDKLYRPTLTEEEAIEVLKTCMSEVKKRFVANLPVFQVMAIDCNGIRRLDDVAV